MTDPESPAAPAGPARRAGRGQPLARRRARPRHPHLSAASEGAPAAWTSPPPAPPPRPRPPAPPSSRVGLADDFDSFLQLLTAQLKAPGPARADGRQPVHRAAGPVQRGRAGDQDQRRAGPAGRADPRRSARPQPRLPRRRGRRGEPDRCISAAPAAPRSSYLLAQSAAQVRIDIYDEAGRLVATRAGPAAAGSHGVAWDGRAPNGARLPAGRLSLRGRRERCRRAEAAGHDQHPRPWSTASRSTASACCCRSTACCCPPTA